jgi:HEPN domain-containing protein
MKDPAEVCRGLLRKARQDRIALDTLLSAQAFDGACFHARQSVGKWLKAFLSYHSVPFPPSFGPTPRWDCRHEFV